MFYIGNKKVKIFTDGANLDSIMKLAADPVIDGITTNPTLMRKSGVTNYMSFANAAVNYSNDKSISLEVFSDDFDEMVEQAKILSKLGKQVYVKIPITNSKGEYTDKVIRKILDQNIKINITAILTKEQIDLATNIFKKDEFGYLSIFAGRIADTGKDPNIFFDYAYQRIESRQLENVELLWASTREVYNIYQAVLGNCDIITAPPEIIKKLALFNYDLKDLSLETVQMFKRDSEKANYIIK